MFKEKYIDWVRNELLTFLPEGYSLKVVEEQGYGASDSPKFEIVVYVKFGVGGKQTNATNRINQPVIFTVKSEGSDFRTANEILNNFFLWHSRTRTMLELTVGDAYDLWHVYYTPVIQTGIEQIGTYQRSTIILTGLVSYSQASLIGVKYSIKKLEDIDYTELDVINPQSQYNTQNLTPQYVNEDVGMTEIEGANNSISFTMLAGNNIISKELIEISIIGTLKKYTLKIEYTPTLAFTFDVVPTSVVVSHDTASGDNILTVNLSRVRT